MLRACTASAAASSSVLRSTTRVPLPGLSLLLLASAMSTTAASAAAAPPSIPAAAVVSNATGRRAGRLIAARKQREGGGFVVRRPFPSSTLESIGGLFLMLDHFGPVDYAPGEAIGAPDHPHRGFQTVTVMYDGEFEHKDSMGTTGKLSAGWVQWMSAGSGVVHSELPSAAFTASGGRMEGMQLWVNLPAAEKMTPPEYQDTPPERIPVVSAARPFASSPASTVRVIAGEYNGTQATIRTRTPITYLDLTVQPGDSIVHRIPAGHVGFLYVRKGKVLAGRDGASAEVPEGTMMLVDEAEKVADADAAADGAAVPADALRVAVPATAASPSLFLLLHGRPINEPIARYGPFVMNTREEILQAVDDYQSGRFGKIQGAEERYAATERAKAEQHKSGRWGKDGREL